MTSHPPFLPRPAQGALLGLAVLAVTTLAGCGQDLTGNASGSSRDALYFNDSAAGLPSMYSGETYSGGFSVAGGAGPYSYRVVSGSLPPGLTLSGASLSGTPTKTGTYKFTVEATDSTLSSKSKEYTVNVNDLPPLALVIGLPGGEIRGETRLPVTVTAPRAVRAARLQWELPENVSVSRVQSAEQGGLLFWKQEGQKLTVDMGFKSVPRSGNRVALISVKPTKPATLTTSKLGYEARDGSGKLLAEQKYPEPPKVNEPPKPAAPTPAPTTDPKAAPPAEGAGTAKPAPEPPVPTVTEEEVKEGGPTPAATPAAPAPEPDKKDPAPTPSPEQKP